MPRTDGQRKGYNEVGLLLLANHDPEILLAKLNVLPATSQYLQGGEMAIADFQQNPQTFTLIGA